MPPTFAWMAAEEDLQPVALTVRAQVISPNDNGQLVWDIFFPRQNVNSVRLAEITDLDDRAVADRREWNARGRYLPMLTPTQREMEMVPIETYDRINEYEMQRLAEGAFGNAAVIQDIIRVRIPDRTDRLTRAIYRRIEVDSHEAWGLGTITQRNPQNASQTYTASFQFDTGRFQTAGTPWDVVANAYDEFVAWFEDGIQAVGSAVGAMMRLSTYKEILRDAPVLGSGIRMTRAELADRISQDTGVPFTFYINENSLDVFDDGGITMTRTKVWPRRVALVPAGLAVGNTAFAPVRRAMEMDAEIPEAGVDVRGVTVYHDEEGMGRELQIEAQLNAMPIPFESRMWVINPGV